MKVLITHEASATVRDAFRARGHDAWSCDLRACERDDSWHIRGDAIAAIRRGGWDLVIMHCDCTYLCSSGQHWVKRGRIEADGRPRAAHVEEAVQHVYDCWDACEEAGVEHRVLESSIGILSTRWRKPDQIIQPNQYGADASKGTCFWLRRLPRLKPTLFVEPRLVCSGCRKVFEYGQHKCPHCLSERFKPRWANQTNSGQNKLPPGDPNRWMDHARTYPGVADAMAEQWGDAVAAMAGAL